MIREDIIFFDQLGCGWVVDARIIRKITPEHVGDESVSERRLFDHVYPEGKDLRR